MSSIQTLHVPQNDETKSRLIAQFTPAALNGSSIGLKMRDTAADALARLAVPTLKTEAWKYTSLRALLKREFTLSTAPAKITGETKTLLSAAAIPGFEADRLVFVNGVFAPSLSDGVPYVKSLNGLTGESLAVFESYFGTLVSPDAGIFTALNTAYAKEGLFVHVAKGKHIEKPLHILHLTEAGGADMGMQVRNLLVVEANASLKIVETYHAAPSESHTLRNAVAEIFVGGHAALDYIKIQEEGDKAAHIERTEIRQANDSHVHMHTYTFGGELVRNEAIMHIEGRHCEAHLRGAYLLNGKQLVDNYTEMHHKQPDCYSNELYKGVLDDRSRGVFNGIIHVYRDAQKTNAFQSNRNLLLSELASMKTKPQLEIYADDVKCSHGAATGQIDDDALFYMKARGINDAAAKRLLVQAFAGEVAESISIEAVKMYVGGLIEGRF